jgi:hypothetical protein
MMMNNDARRIELSTKLNKMSMALKEEGLETKDNAILNAGNVLGLLSTIILFEKDMEMFAMYSGMFSSWRILDIVINGEPDNLSPEVTEHFRKLTDEFETKLGLKKNRRGGRKKGNNGGIPE